ncbi:MAG: hypothetical protein M3R38_01805 [Actinomycetota bacterium]|nr:hypothetical protein [Actinomycetota bacterium]
MGETKTGRVSPPAWFLRASRKAGLNERWFADAKGRRQENNWHHKEWFELAERHHRLLIEAAREHSKTQVFAITQPLAEMALNLNVRILVVSDVYPKAQERTKVLREHIEKNAVIRKDTGARLKIARKKGDEEFTLERDFYWLKEPTVRSTYAGGPIAGGRYDLVIADDLVNYLDNANTPGKRSKLARWWHDEVENSVVEGGKIWVIGTHQHHSDLYEELKKDPSYFFAVYPAVDEEDTGYGHLGYAEKNLEHSGATGLDGICLWPQAHDYARHMGKKENPATHDSYLRQQQQLAVPETGLVYPKPLVDAALRRGHDVAYEPEAAQFVGLDPGYGKRAAMLCIQEASGDRVEVWREHSFTQLADEDVSRVVCDHCEEHSVEVVYVDAEDPGLRKKIANDLKARGVKTATVGVPFSKYKRLGIKATRWLLQTGRVSWKAEATTVHTPGRVRTEPSIFRDEISAYALQEGEDDVPQKSDDHGPDAWVAYANRWIRPWLKATDQGGGAK